MPALSEVVAYQSAVDDVSTLTIAELIRFWRALDVEDSVASAVAVREFMPDLVDSYQPMAAEVAASFYDDSRQGANARGSFVADLAPGKGSDWLQSRISWAVAPLFRTVQRVDADPVGGGAVTRIAAPNPDLALARLSGETQLEIADGARDTIEHNADRDPAIARFARHASANACAFCRLMATRGAVYRTAASAGNGHKYHSHCHCVAYPVFVGEVDESPDYVLQWEKDYRAARKEARKASAGKGLKDILPFMRQVSGAS